MENLQTRNGRVFIVGDRQANSGQDQLSSTLQGNLSDKPIAYLLSIAQHCDATGYLHIGPRACEVVIQLALGSPRYASSPMGKGHEVIMDLFTWKSGSISFEPGKLPESVNVDETIEQIVAYGEVFSHDTDFLHNHLITEQSILLRGPKCSKDEFETMLKGCKTVKSDVLAELFSSIYGTLNLLDVAERLNLPRSQWVMGVAYLLRSGALVAPDGTSLKTNDTGVNLLADLSRVEAVASAVAATAEMEVVQTSVPLGLPAAPVVLKHQSGRISLDLLSNPDTGIISAEVMEFFVVAEFLRAVRFKTPLTLMVFCLCQDSTSASAIYLEHLRTILTLIDGVRREVDMFGHFGERTYALLLPNVLPEQASVLADRIGAQIAKDLPAFAASGMSMHFGIAGAPTDAVEVVTLAMGAQQAMKAAHDSKALKMLVNQLRA
jgi:hypothetical protein